LLLSTFVIVALPWKCDCKNDIFLHIPTFLCWWSATSCCTSSFNRTSAWILQAKPSSFERPSQVWKKDIIQLNYNFK
jgi:hypothetical protein